MSEGLQSVAHETCEPTCFSGWYFSGNATGLIATQQGTINYMGHLFLDSDSNGDAFLAVGRDDASLFLGGNSSLVQSGNGGAVLVNAGDHSNSMLAGTGTVLDLGNGNAVGILAHGNSTITVSGNYQINEEGNGDSLLIVARDSSSTLLDGEFIGSNDGNSRGMSPIQLNDFARLNFVGGRVRNEWLSRGAVDAVSLTGQSFMNWTGGKLESISRGNALVPTVSVAQESILIVSGTIFNRPYGPVTELTGSISGVLQDGSPVEFDFKRGINATILLVPEPSCLSIAGLALILMTQLRHGKRTFVNARP